MVITESSLCDSSSSRYSRPFSPRTGALDGVTLMAETRTQSLRMMADQHLKYLAASALIAQQTQPTAAGGYRTHNCMPTVATQPHGNVKPQQQHRAFI